VAAMVVHVVQLEQGSDLAGSAALLAVGLSPTLFSRFLLLLELLRTLIFGTVAVALVWRRPENRMALLTAVMLTSMGLIAMNNSSLVLLNDAWPVLTPVIALLRTLGIVTFVLFIYTFPHGRFSTPLVAVAALLACLWFIAVTLFTQAAIAWAGFAFVAIVSAIFYLPVPVLVRHDLRHTGHLSHIEQQQMKWITTGLMIAFVGYIFIMSAQIVNSWLPANNLIWLVVNGVSAVVANVTLSMVPLTIGFAILRYRLWGVDFVINRTLVYGSLTIGLVIITIVNLLLLQWVLQLLTGRDQSTMALIVAALVSGAVFQPTRRRLQRWIDRHVYGIHIAYQRPKKEIGEEASLLPPVAPDETLGSYRLQELIGRGGMAEVYRGQHITLNRPVAIKIMRSDQASVADFRTRFEREARAIAKLRHPNIIEIFDFGVVGDTYYMVMEYVTGQSLSDYLRQNGRLPLAEALLYIGELADALDYAHSQQIVHRDIKPSNVMLQPITTISSTAASAWKAILTDFGIAKIRDGSTALTQTGMVGTLDYIAPEQIRDAKDVDGRADLYALAVLAYQIITGQLPFPGSNPAAIVIAHLQQPPPDPRHLVPDLPPQVTAVLHQGMAKAPQDRYATAGAFAKALASATAGQPFNRAA
jgi:tRNA A-37 threonylcarbamoyl transferase component Bud32